MNIAAAQVQRPGDVVERRDEHSVGMLLAQSLADAAQLRWRVLASILQRMDLHGILRDGRTVVPDEAQRVVVRAQREAALLAKVGDEVLDECRRVRHTVGSHLLRATVAQLLSQPLRDGRRVGHLQLHQLELRAPQLLLGSEEVAGVGPQGGTRHRDHSGACRAVEAADPLATLPVVGHVFAVVRIGTCEDVGS